MRFGYNYYDFYPYGSSAYSTTSVVISIAMAVLSIVCMWRIFTKAGKPGWASIVPIYNLYVLFEITWGSGVKFLLLLIPLANVVIAIITVVKLAKVFGKGGGFACGLLFLNVIFLPILAFGSARYIGTGAQNPYGQPYPGQGYQPGYQQPGYQQSGHQQNNYQQPGYGAGTQTRYAPPPQGYGQSQPSYWQQPPAAQAPQNTAAQAQAQKFCPYCGSPLPDGAVFCTHCGAKAN